MIDMSDLAKLNDALAVYDDVEALQGQQWFALAGIYGIALKVARALLEDHHAKISKLTRDHDIFQAVIEMYPGRADDVQRIYRVKPFYDFIMRRLEVPIPFDANVPEQQHVMPRVRNATIRLLALAVQVRSKVHI